MAFSDATHTTETQHGRDTNGWFDLLAAETERLEMTGLLGAVVSVFVNGDERSLRQTENLLGRYLTSPSEVSVIDDTSLSVLLVPVFNLSTLNSQVREMSEMLRSAVPSVSVSYALRRPNESLVDTWARADAELDRATFRSVHRGSQLNLRNL